MNYSMNYIHCISHTAKLTDNLLGQKHQATNFNRKHNNYGAYKIQHVMHQTLLYSPSIVWHQHVIRLFGIRFYVIISRGVLIWEFWFLLITDYILSKSTDNRSPIRY